MSHTTMRHVTNGHEPYPDDDAHVGEPLVNNSYHTRKSVLSHMGMSHVWMVMPTLASHW